jgi:hypothetical protein
MSSIRSVCVITAFVCLATAGCASVEPWERGNLAKPHMALDPNGARTVMRTHTFVSREAAAGGDSAEGGGCGCQ